MKRKIRKLPLVLSALSLTGLGFSAFVVSNNEVTIGYNIQSSEPIVFIENDYDNQNDNQYFTSIAKALNYATSGDRVIVIPPSKEYTTIEDKTIHVDEDLTIKNGVSLILPFNIVNTKDPEYGEESLINDAIVIKNEGTSYANRSGTGVSFADKDEESVKTNLKLNVQIEDGHTINIEEGGKLIVGGQLGVGTSNQTPTGHTTGNYAQITLGDKSKIINKGTIDCYGYIKEKTLTSINEDNSFIQNVGGIVYEPFVIYDYRGGSNTSGMYLKGNMTPFAVYDFPNIQTKISFDSNSQLYGYADLFTSSMVIVPERHNLATINMLSDSSNSLIQLANDAVLTSKYSSLATSTNNKPNLYTQFADNTQDAYSKTELKFTNGEVYTNGMQLGISVLGVSINLSTDTVYFPVPYKYQVSLENCNVDFNSKFRFMPGSSLYIDESSIVNFNENMMFYQSYEDKSTIRKIYPTKEKLLAKGFSDKADLVVDGELNVKSNFGGYIQPGSKGTATLNFASTFKNGVAEKEGQGDVSKGDLLGNTSEVLAGNLEVIAKCCRFATYANYSESAVGPYFNSQTGNNDLYFEANQSFRSKDCNWVNNLESSDSFYIKKYRVKFEFATKEESNIDEFTVTVADDSNGINSKVYNLTRDNMYPILVKEGQYFKLESDSKATIALTTPSGSYTKGQYIQPTQDYLFTITLDADQNTPGCVIEGTLVTMADGSYRKVEELKNGDLLMVFNHETGKLDGAPIMVYEKEPLQEYRIINCQFDDELVKINYEHGFFDLDLNKYVYFNDNNYANFIGHRFVGFKNGQKTIQTLKDCYVTYETCKVYGFATYKHYNCITNNILSIEGGIDGLFNIFEYENDSLRYDPVKKQQDIEKYGLYTYDDLKHIANEIIFDAANGPYLKVAVGKGILTLERFKEIVDRYGDEVELN